ncbi:MAG: DUF3990 domain-containing protein [Lachnospiraceae bacterium]|nr:DUF3990 domain-containing protein [Lachnospiraceae bacterium]
MKLYHTGKEEIRQPDLDHGRKNADFGPGFYLTPDKDFAFRWAGKGAVINEYEFDEEGLTAKTFERDLSWFNYIFANRKGKDLEEADYVKGPIANDTIYDTLGVLTSGLLSSEEALKILLIGPCYIQVAIKSQKALSKLKWLKSEEIKDHGKYAVLLKEEQERYQNTLAEAISD